MQPMAEQVQRLPLRAFIRFLFLHQPFKLSG
jgi:hypothetical protein